MGNGGASSALSALVPSRRGSCQCCSRCAKKVGRQALRVPEGAEEELDMMLLLRMGLSWKIHTAWNGAGGGSTEQGVEAGIS